MCKQQERCVQLDLHRHDRSYLPLRSTTRRGVYRGPTDYESEPAANCESTSEHLSDTKEEDLDEK